MTDRIAVYMPTFGRPNSLHRVAENVRAATTYPHILVFACEHDDEQSIAEAGKWGRVVVNHGSPSFSNSLQVAYESDDSRYFIAANDDFDFQAGWDTAALALMNEHTLVVGLHDGSPQCGFTTISLVARRYIEEMSGVIDMPGRVNYPYRHNYVDTEFHATAVHRGVFRACPDSVVLHKHPDWGHVATDDTYLKSQSTIGVDATTFASRTHLWQT